MPDISILNIDNVWITVAFFCGFVAKQTGLPPLIGFLAAGFLLKALDVTDASIALEEIADIGVMLLLFTIGLKLKVKQLIRAEIWLTTSLHTLGSTLFFTSILYGAGLLGLSFIPALTLNQTILIAFALSFSSTVFAIKVLEEKGDMSARHGRIAIGVLVMQDLFAVLFLTISKGQMPSIYVLGLPFFLYLARFLSFRLMDRAGHGELFALFGIFAALVAGAYSFELVHLKPDLGALIFGAMLANHPRASELSKTLLGLKDLFLVGFFFNIGLSGIPTLSHIILALCLVAILLFKTALFFALFTRFRLRSRTALLSSFCLSHYSEFGLIVAAVSVQSGWLSNDWIIILALALSFSFVAAAPLNQKVFLCWDRCKKSLLRFQSQTRLSHDPPVKIGNAKILVMGMGRVGIGAYETLSNKENLSKSVLAIDSDYDVVNEQQQSGRRIILGDATDSDFWEQLEVDAVNLVMMAMPNHTSNVFAIEQLRKMGYLGNITAIAKFDDELIQLKEAGATEAFNIYAEAGAGYAQHICTTLCS